MPDDLLAPWHLFLAAGTRIEPDATGPVLRWGEEHLALGFLPDAVARALGALGAEGLPEEVLLSQVEQEGGPPAALALIVLLSRLARRGVLRYAVHAAEGVLATLEPLSPRFELAPRAPDPGQPLLLSRFAHVRRDGGALVLESPRAYARVVLGGAGAWEVLAAFARPLAPARLEARLGGLMSLLARAGFLLEATSEGITEEEREPALALWEFQDLLFHAASRRRLYGRGLGGTYRLASRVAPPPAVRPPRGPLVALSRPELDGLMRDDPPLAQVMERRRSQREPGARPPTLAQVAALLFRCARVREVLPGERDEVSRRPCPSGGARHPLEVYVCVRACEGLAPGLYRYAPQDHALERLGDLTPAVGALLADAQVGSEPPHVLLTLAARFARTSFKYESIAYALILKEAGVLLHALSLVATALGLASCMVGWGDPDTFERATGLDSASESSVAELALSGLREDGA